jgi:hypothetical protein
MKRKRRKENRERKEREPIKRKENKRDRKPIIIMRNGLPLGHVYYFFSFGSPISL